MNWLVPLTKKGGVFAAERTTPENPKWDQCIKREEELYTRKKSVRSPFYRDYTRILHSTAYRRLKHKTQVFFATENDHICTRIEHVNHVASVSYTISKCLGLDTELTSAIAIGHDLGHAPFGHEGERILKKLVKDYLNEDFWHERNSLRFVDLIETLPDPEGYDRNLALTYAVRDGIVAHCGEIDENGLSPRNEPVNLAQIRSPNQFFPFSWEACVVKIADKIAYLGRDIEDAMSLGIITLTDAKDFLRRLDREPRIELKRLSIRSFRELNNTVIMDELVSDLLENSSPTEGIRFSEYYYLIVRAIKNFNYDRIYSHSRLAYFREYAGLMIRSIFEALLKYFSENRTKEMLKRDASLYPDLIKYFSAWLVKYSSAYPIDRNALKHGNKPVYDLKLRNEYIASIIDFISGMTDSFAIKCFRELTTF